MPQSILEILLKLTGAEDAKKGLEGLSGSMKNLGAGMTSAGRGMTMGLTAPIMALGGAALLLTKDAGELEGVSAAFEGMTKSAGGSADVMLAALAEQSQGMVANVDLMKQYNLATQLVGEEFAGQLPDAMGYLGKVAAATGEDMGYMMDSMVRGIGRLSPMILDNLGIQVDMTAANEAYAESMGITTGEMTKAQQQTALTNQVMELLAANTANMPEVGDTAAQAFGSLTATFKNLRDEVGTQLIPVIVPLIQQFGEFLGRLMPIISGLVEKFGALSPTIKTIILVVIAVVAAIGPLLMIFGTLISAIGAIIPVITAVVAVLSGPVLLVFALVAGAIALFALAWI